MPGLSSCMLDRSLRRRQPSVYIYTASAETSGVSGVGRTIGTWGSQESAANLFTQKKVARKQTISRPCGTKQLTHTLTSISG